MKTPPASKHSSTCILQACAVTATMKYGASPACVCTHVRAGLAQSLSSHLLPLPDASRGLQAVHDRHLDVHEDEIVPAPGQFLQHTPSSLTCGRALLTWRSLPDLEEQHIMAGEREEEAEEAARCSTRGMRIKAEDEDEEGTKLEGSETLAHHCSRRQQSHAPVLRSLVTCRLLSPPSPLPRVFCTIATATF